MQLFRWLRRNGAVVSVRHVLFFSLIVLSGSYAAAQDFPVKGKVSNEKGEPLAAVTVQVKGGRGSATTGADGSYQLSVPDRRSVLVFTSVGYKSQEVPLGGRAQVDVVLGQQQSDLNEVVVVGYGTQRRSDVTGAVATFNARSVEEKPIGRIEQALIGQMPGVQVRQQSGMAGSGLSILVRGTGSITAGNEPLYVLDGFPLDVSGQNSNGGFTANPLDNLNPNDIESIQVLKDASAGAIYGSRAANGVVIITTKRGQVGNAKISANVKTGVASVSRKLDLLSAQEWTVMAAEEADSAWVHSKAGRTADQTNAQRAAILNLTGGTVNPSYMTDPRWAEAGHPGLQYVDWQDAVYRRAAYQNYELSASGGSENVRYFISGNYLDQDGTVIGSNYINYGVRANVEANASKKFKVGLNLAPSYSINNLPAAEGKDNQLMHAAQMTPVVEDSVGLNTGAYGLPTYTWGSAKLISPYAYLKNSQNRIATTRLLGDIYAEYQILPGLVLRSTINYDGLDRSTKNYVSDKVAVGAASALTTNPGLYSTGSYAEAKKQNFLNENTISYNKVFGDHSVAAVAGFSYNHVHYETESLATAGGFANDNITTLSNAIANSAGVTFTGTNTETNSSLVSYYGRVQYAYQDKYLVSGTLRRDASSRFGLDNRWGTFPSASVGWRVSKEAFFDDVRAINDLKLRFSWGKSGNNNIGDYNSIQTLTNTTYSFGGTSATAQVVSGLANPRLKWETSDTYDAGADVSFLKNRINVTIDAYYKKNTDLLLNLPVLSASGFTSQLQNIGAVVNKGLEVNLGTTNIRTSNFTWTMTANIAFNKNAVTALGPDGAAIQIASNYSGSNAPYLLKKGLPAFSYYITKSVGILTPADIADPKVAKVSGETVGDEKYLDANHDGKITADDRVVDGHPNPNYTFGWTNTFKYKDFDLGVTVYGQHGGTILSYLGRAIDLPGSTTANILGVWRGRWTPQNPNWHAPRGKLFADYTVPYVTSDWMYSSDFLRVQNITLGYNLKRLFGSSKAFNTARLYVSLENYFSHDKYKGGANPEAQNTNNSGNGSYGVPGDYGAMPLSKTASIGLNVGF